MASAKVSSFSFAEIIKYATVGIVSTVIDMGLLKILTVIGWPVWLAVAVGFLAGTVNGYYMNSRWTFRYQTAGREGLKFSQFAIVSLIGLGLTELIVNFYLSSVNQGLSILSFGLSATMTGKVIAVAIVFVWNYLANKLWTFRK